MKQIDVPSGVPDEEREEIRQRFLREARTAAKLHHRSATTVYDVVEEDGVPFIIMEFVEAPNLAEHVERNGPLDEKTAASIGLDLAAALGAAHAEGILHRDVKPSNVMIPPDGPAILTDFGIATFAEDPRITQTGQAMGSPAYMAPEQARDEDLGPATDLWGLGATLYFAVEGASPFGEASTASTLQAVVGDPPRRFERADHLGPVVWALLEKDPADRPSLDEVSGLLEAVRDEREPDIGATKVIGSGAAAATTQAMAGPAGGDGGRTQRLGTGDGSGTETSPGAHPDAEPAQVSAPGGRATRTEERVEVRRDGGSGSRAPAFVLLAVLVLILGALGLAWMAGGDDPPPSDDLVAEDEEVPAADETGDEEPATDDPGEAEPADDPDDPQHADGEDDSEDEEQSRWQRYEAQGEPYSVTHPPGWEIRRLDDTRTDIVDPESGDYVRIAWTDDPHDDPYEDRQEYSEQFAAENEDYEEIRLERTTWRGYDAAIWEFAYSDGGTRLRAAQLNLTTGSYGYSLMFQTSAGAWDERGHLFDRFQDGFEVQG